MLDSFVLDKLGSVRAQYEELGAKLEQPDIQANIEELLKATKERAKLEPTVFAHDIYIAAESSYADAKEMFSECSDDADMREMAREEARQTGIAMVWQSLAHRIIAMRHRSAALAAHIMCCLPNIV